MSYDSHMTRNHYDWAEIVRTARARPGRWVCLFPDHPTSLVRSIRRRKSVHLRRDDGCLEATVVNRYHLPGFPPRGDIWVRWVPNNQP